MANRVPDWLLLNGKRRMLISHPLDPYLRDLPVQPDLRVTENGNTHGYVATWEVRADDTLWLTALQTRPANDPADPGLRSVFPEAQGPIAATWVSQRLRSPEGIRFDARGYGSTYASETRLTVWEGKVILIEEYRGEQRESEAFTPHLEAIFGAEESAFIRSVHAKPEDSAPRLIYADWLDERGDARANLIRHAEQLRAMPSPGITPEMAAEWESLTSNRGHALWMQLMGYVRLFGSPLARS